MRTFDGINDVFSMSSMQGGASPNTILHYIHTIRVGSFFNSIPQYVWVHIKIAMYLCFLFSECQAMS